MLPAIKIALQQKSLQDKTRKENRCNFPAHAHLHLKLHNCMRVLVIERWFTTLGYNCNKNISRSISSSSSINSNSSINRSSSSSSTRSSSKIIAASKSKVVKVVIEVGWSRMNGWMDEKIDGWIYRWSVGWMDVLNFWSSIWNIHQTYTQHNWESNPCL